MTPEQLVATHPSYHGRVVEITSSLRKPPLPGSPLRIGSQTMIFAYSDCPIHEDTSLATLPRTLVTVSNDRLVPLLRRIGADGFDLGNLIREDVVVIAKPDPDSYRPQGDSSAPVPLYKRPLLGQGFLGRPSIIPVAILLGYSGNISSPPLGNLETKLPTR
jgi:hypothetical protein